MVDLVKLAHLLNTLRARREATERAVLGGALTLSVPELRRLEAEYVALGRRIARLEVRLK